MPRKGKGKDPVSKPVRSARRVRMVEAKLAGTSTSAIARAEGLSRDWAARELDSGESRQIIAELVDRNFERIATLYEQTLGVIEAAFQADRVAVTPAGVVTIGAD